MKGLLNRLLVVAGIFLLFFVILAISLPLLVQTFGIDLKTRSGMLVSSVYQAVILFILPAILSSYAISRRPFQYLGLTRAPGWLPILGTIFAYLIALPALNQIVYWNANISFPAQFELWEQTLRSLEESAQATAATMLAVSSLPAMLLNLAVVALLTAFAEELFFRGALQNTAASTRYYHTAIWVVAFFFSAFHFQIFGFVPRLILGAWFGYLLVWTRSLYVPIFAHFLNNGVVVVCTWLAQNGVNYDFDNFGVVKTGFPMPAFISAVATVVFLVYFANYFFHRQSPRQHEFSGV